ncbi:MAG TPA: DUF3500 domain-containing protein [Terrimesophilobacter sp.]|nr:DUF3500 domain-containing protein [Terrimesophilobacter sp.]HRP98918.1 DUF3500 domain-containing protein [Terrimesophilobacter sp.]
MTDNDHDIDGFFSTARVSARDEAVELDDSNFRNHLYDLDDPALAPWRGMNYEEFTAARQDNEFLQQLLNDWNALYQEPFFGITSDGTLRDVHQLGDPLPGNAALIAAARGLLTALGPEERERVQYPLDAGEWRAWSNPEFVFHRVGLRLENLSVEIIEAVCTVLRAALSAEGYEQVREAMALNGFLGKLVELPGVMNEHSYWFSIFGEPAQDAPWGFQLFGHHVAVNFFTVDGHDVVAPVFIGAEPALTGERPPIFDERERLALRLAGSLSETQRSRCVVYDSVLDPAMPEGRLHPADERHVAGAFRDNRVVPHEGIKASEFDDEQRGMLRKIVEDFHLLSREPQRERLMAQFDRFLDDTWFSWYGETDGSSPIYFRIHSPVVLAELDNHAGVWLSNRLPARFHVHSVLRLPNGNDYGRAFLAQWRARQEDDATVETTNSEQITNSE